MYSYQYFAAGSGSEFKDTLIVVSEFVPLWKHERLNLSLRSWGGLDRPTGGWVGGVTATELSCTLFFIITKT